MTGRDGIEFVLTRKERAFAAWVTVHIERLRRERNRMDARYRAAPSSGCKCGLGNTQPPGYPTQADKDGA